MLTSDKQATIDVITGVNAVVTVDDMRNIGSAMLKSHFTSSMSAGKVHRVEYLPIYWYDAIHGDDTGTPINLVTRRLSYY